MVVNGTSLVVYQNGVKEVDVTMGRVSETGNGDSIYLFTQRGASGNWTWATNFTGTTNSGECSIVEVEPNVIELILRNRSGKKRYRIFDLGRTAFVDMGGPRIPGDQNDQGSFLHFTTKSGAKIDLISNAQNESNVDYVRDQITLYYFDRYSDNKDFKAIRVFEYEKAGAPINSAGSNFSGTQFGGYSAIEYGYNPKKDGEMLLIVVEDDVGVSLYNASDLLPGLENCYFNNLDRFRHNIYPSGCFGYFDTRRYSNYVPMVQPDGHCEHGLEIYGSYKSNGVIDPSKFSPSSIVDGGIHLVPGTDACGVFGYIGAITGDAVTITFTFHIPTQSGQTTYVPIVRFFNSMYGRELTNIMGGLEVRDNGEIYITKANNEAISSALIGHYEHDKTYNAVVEFVGTTVSLYFDGALIGTVTVNSNYLGLMKGGKFFGIGNPGSSNKSLDIHIGNIGIYNRILTHYERKNFPNANGLPIRDNLAREKELMNTIRQIKLQTSPLPKIWNMVVNMNENTFRTGKTINGDKDDFLSTIPGDIVEIPLIIDGHTDSPVTTLGNPKLSGYGDNERAYNPNNGFWWVPRDPRLTWLDISQFNVDSTDGFTVEVCFDHEAIDGEWTSPFVMSNNPLLTDPTNDNYKRDNCVRLEVNTRNQHNMCVFSMNNDNFTPRSPMAGNVEFSGSTSRIHVVFTLSGRDIKVYRDFANTYTGQINFDFGVLKYLLFSRGSVSFKFANMKIYRLRVWKDILTLEDIKRLNYPEQFRNL